MTDPLAVVVPRRLSTGADPRIVAANRLFDLIVALAEDVGLTPIVTDDPDYPLEGVGGVLLPGGGDVNPRRYGCTSTAAVYDVNDEQDHLDFTLTARARDAQLPILGICRGAQVLNVAYGGDLQVDLAAGSVDHGAAVFSWHPVHLAPGTRVRAAHGADELVVASAHHQAVASLGAGLVTTAWADDGVIEAFEAETGWVFAIQWHPEAPGVPKHLQQAPFKAFADAVAQSGRGALSAQREDS